MDEKACTLDSIHLLGRRILIDLYEKTPFASQVNGVFFEW